MFVAGNYRSHDIAACPPDGRWYATDSGSPSPRAVLSPLTKRVKELVSGKGLRSQDRAPNLGVLHRGIEIFLIPAAPVHFYEVESLFRKLQEVLLIMAFASGVKVLRAQIGEHATAAFAGIRVDPGLETKAVNKTNNVAHIARVLAGRKCRPCFRIHYDVSLRI